MNCYEEKKAFVENELQALVKKINKEVLSVDYEREGYCEAVGIYFLDGYKRVVSVSGDSLQAVTEDVLTRL